MNDYIPALVATLLIGLAIWGVDRWACREDEKRRQFHYERWNDHDWEAQRGSWYHRR